MPAATRRMPTIRRRPPSRGAGTAASAAAAVAANCADGSGDGLATWPSRSATGQVSQATARPIPRARSRSTLRRATRRPPSATTFRTMSTPAMTTRRPLTALTRTTTTKRTFIE